MSGYDKFFKDAQKAAEKRNSSGKSSNSKSSPKMQAGRLNQSSRKNLTLNNEAEGPRVHSALEKPMRIAPEDQLRMRLAESIKQKKAKASRRKQSFPIGAAIAAALVVVACFFGFNSPDAVEKWANKIDIGFFGSAVAADSKGSESQKEKEESPAQAAAEKSAPAEPDRGEKSSTSERLAKSDEVPDVRTWSEEELSFFKKLNERKKELDLRESELTRLEEELQKQKAELDLKIKRLEETRAQISETLKTRVAEDQKKVEKLVEFYSTMKAQQAAKIIESLNEDLAIEVIEKMKKKNAAEILNAMDPKKARRLSEILTGYQRAPASGSLNGNDSGDLSNEIGNDPKRDPSQAPPSPAG
jgi:flagellar motility protein MotE (MotC chaperone)